MNKMTKILYLKTHKINTTRYCVESNYCEENERKKRFVTNLIINFNTFRYILSVYFVITLSPSTYNVSIQVLFLYGLYTFIYIINFQFKITSFLYRQRIVLIRYE